MRRVLSCLVLASIVAGAALAADNNPNAFNRLMKNSFSENAPPTEDGIHDPMNPGTPILQAPHESFAPLPKSQAGNRIDWVRALNDGLIAPRADLFDPNAEKDIMDLDIVMEVKGSMPDVVYPHLQHTEWLDCANCHTDIFIPQRGKNQISMAAILLGEKCGVCHGKVAFPVSDCRRCHSRPKSQVQQAAATADPEPEAEVEVAAGEEIDMAALGEEVYLDNCSACHGEEGEGMGEDFPPMAGSPVATGPIDAHIDVVMRGVEETAMSPWYDLLEDVELAAVITYERNAFGNDKGDSVSVEEIAAVRAAIEN